MVVTVAFMLNLPLSLAFKVKTFEGNLYHMVMSPGNQTEPTHVQTSLMFYKFTLPVPKQCKVTSPGLLVIMCVCVCLKEHMGKPMIIGSQSTVLWIKDQGLENGYLNWEIVHVVWKMSRQFNLLLPRSKVNWNTSTSLKWNRPSALTPPHTHTVMHTVEHTSPIPNIKASYFTASSHLMHTSLER